VEQFFVPGRPYSQLSDHYGVGLDVQIQLRSEEAVYIVDWVWENQRRKMLFGKFGGGSLISTDRKPYCPMEDVDTLRPLDDTLPDNTWEWVDDWEVHHREGTDEEGWEYAIDFPASYSAAPGAMSTVRRRLWRRVRTKNVQRGARQMIAQRIGGTILEVSKIHKEVESVRATVNELYARCSACSEQLMRAALENHVVRPRDPLNRGEESSSESEALRYQLQSAFSALDSVCEKLKAVAVEDEGEIADYLGSPPASPQRSVPQSRRASVEELPGSALGSSLNAVQVNAGLALHQHISGRSPESPEATLKESIHSEPLPDPVALLRFQSCDTFATVEANVCEEHLPRCANYDLSPSLSPSLELNHKAVARSDSFGEFVSSVNAEDIRAADTGEPAGDKWVPTNDE